MLKMTSLALRAFLEDLSGSQMSTTVGFCRRDLSWKLDVSPESKNSVSHLIFFSYKKYSKIVIKKDYTKQLNTSIIKKNPNIQKFKYTRGREVLRAYNSFHINIYGKAVYP